MGLDFEESGVEEIAKRSRGTPRIALRLLRRVRDFSEVRSNGQITSDASIEALGMLSIDQLGLDEVDRMVLLTIIKKYGGGPVGLSTIAASISEEPDTIMDVVEPYLLQLGFLSRTAQGRMATEKAYQHLKLPYNGKKSQPSLLK
jgi:Holliday junction DNA helicase RuvB